MNRALLYILNKIVQEKTKKGRSTMTTEQTTATAQNNNNGKKFAVFKYAYGQIYSGYLKSGKAEKFVITNIHVREWKGILNYFKRNEYIVDFMLGDTIETACDLGIVGFNEGNIPYVKYAEGVRKNVEKEMAEGLKAEEVQEAA